MQSLATRYRVFSVNYVPATNTRPSRVKVKDLRRNVSKIVSYDSSDSDMEMTAHKYLLSKGIECTAMGMMENDFLLLSEDFETPLV
jgi:hypothetical protein